MQRVSWRFELFFVGFVLALLLYQLGGYPLLLPDEGRYGEIAREMATSHDWLTPRLNGIPFLDKPIFFYWMTASFIWLLGAKLWVVRLWPLLIALFGTMMVYYAAWKLYGQRAARLAACILVTTPLYFLAGHYVNMDLTVAVFISSSLCSFIIAVHAEKRRHQLFHFLMAYVFAGFAILSKGLIGIVFPMLIIGTWMMLTKQWQWLRKMCLLGLLLTAGICVPWMLAQHHSNPHFFHYFFINQHFERYTQTHFNNLQPWWFYPVVAFVGFLPWSIIWPSYRKNRLSTQHWRQNTYFLSTAFFILWAVIVMVFFSIPASKLVGYILPIFPPLVLLMSHCWDQHWPLVKHRFFICMGISIMLLIGIMTYLPKLHRYDNLALSSIIQSQNLKANEHLNIYHLYLPDLSFYLQQEINIVANWGPPFDLMTDGWKKPFFYAKAWNMGNHHMIEEKDFWPRWKQGPKQLIVVRSDVLNYFLAQAQKKYRLIWHDGHMYLFSNQSELLNAQNLPLTKVKQATMPIAKATAKG